MFIFLDSCKYSVYGTPCRKHGGYYGSFDESLTEKQILALGDEIGKRPEIREMKYVSAQEAWDSFKAEYFAGHEELAEGFAEDNPLAGSASYVIF